MLTWSGRFREMVCFLWIQTWNDLLPCVIAFIWTCRVGFTGVIRFKLRDTKLSLSSNEIEFIQQSINKHNISYVPHVHDRVFMPPQGFEFMIYFIGVAEDHSTKEMEATQLAVIYFPVGLIWIRTFAISLNQKCRAICKLQIHVVHIFYDVFYESYGSPKWN